MSARDIMLRLRLGGQAQTARGLKRTATATRDLGDETARAGRAAAGMGADVQAMGADLRRADRQASNLTETLKGIGGVAAGAAAAVVGGIGIGDALGREMSTDQLAASLGLSGPEAAKAGKLAGDLWAGAYGESMDEASRAVAAAMSLPGDLQGGALKTATTQALDFAKAFDVDVSEAALSVGNILNEGLAADAKEAFDLLAAASMRVPVALRGEIMEASDEYAKFFAGLGYTGQETFAVLADAADLGAYGIDYTGTAAQTFQTLAADVEASADAYRNLGLDADTMANRILAGGSSAKGATREIIDALLAIDDPAAQTAAAVDFFGTALEDLGKDKTPEFLKAMRGSSSTMDQFVGVMAQLSDTLNDNAGTRFETFKRGLQSTFMDLMDGQVIPAIERFGPALTPFAIGLGGVGAAVGVVAGATWAWNAALAVNPVVRWASVIALAAAGLYTLYQNVGGVRSAVNSTFSWIRDNWPLLAGILTRGIVLAVLTIVRNWDRIKTGATDAFNWVKDAGSKAASFMLGLPITFFTGAKNIGLAIIRGIIRGIEAIGPEVLAAIESIPGVGLLADAAGGIANLIVRAAGIDGARADGGPIGRTGNYLVGERGPEIVRLAGGSHVFDAADSADMLEGGGSAIGGLGGDVSTRLAIALERAVLALEKAPHRPVSVQINGREIAFATAVQWADEAAAA